MKGGSTLVLKSEGVVKEHQADVLGVYRMIDSYNERPVYKQDGGENYIYYSAASCSWLVGAVVGHQYGWLRNTTAEAGASRWVPDLTSGYQLLSSYKDLFWYNFGILKGGSTVPWYEVEDWTAFKRPAGDRTTAVFA